MNLDHFSLPDWEEYISSINEIRAIGSAYDSGSYDLGKTLSVVLHRIFNDELRRTGMQHLFEFPSFGIPYNPNGLLKTHSLFALKITNLDFEETGYWSEVQFIPSPQLNKEVTLKVKEYKKEIVLAEPRVRKKFSREGIIELARNKSGAHNDKNKGEAFEMAFRNSASFSPIRNMPDGSTLLIEEAPQFFRIVSSPLSAMMRTISEELIFATDSLIESLERGS
jgi:hypothetical protein